MIEIYHRFTMQPIQTVEGDTLRGADLRFGNLQFAHLTGANLTGASLRHANLSGAHCYRADFEGANLRNAHFNYAELRWANFKGALLNWQSHDLLAEILRQEAGEDTGRRAVAGLILVSREFCWADFLRIKHPQKEWALRTLASYAAGDERAPYCLRPYLNSYDSAYLPMEAAR